MIGTFKNINNTTISVFINDSSNIQIGGDAVKFASSPITISYNIDDEFETIIRKSAKITLVTKEYLGEYLFTTNAREIDVTISSGNTTVFNGFVSPLAFSQPFAKVFDELDIECIDFLSTLKYFNYKNSNTSNYDTLKQNATIKTFKEIILNILPQDALVLYDFSKDNLSKYSIHEINFFDDDADSVWTLEEVLSELLRYLNLHIIQDGNNFYIFDWNTIKNRNTTFKDLRTNINVIVAANLNVINQNMFADSDTNISIDDVFNQIQIDCKFNAQDKLFESPLDKDSLVSLYSGKQKYMTEYISEINNNLTTAKLAMINMLQNVPTSYDGASTVDWYCQIMNNPNWKFYTHGENTIENVFEQDANGEYINQWKIPKYLKENQITTGIFRMGKVETKGGNILDNSPISNIQTNDYLFISVNGNENDSEANHSPSDSTLETQSPIIEYVGNSSGGIFSPSDVNTINYLVFSGELVLMPIQKDSGTYENWEQEVINWEIVPSSKGEDGRYYIRKWYNTEYVNDEATTVITGKSLHPFTQDTGNHIFEYNYSAVGDGTDRFSKLPILECELTIGNKRLIETNMDEYGNSEFQWVTIGNEPTESYVDTDGTTKTYTVKTFSLGVNPKIGDKIIGQNFKLQNTIRYQMNIDAEGTAIPIKKTDMVSGRVNFKIVGVINTLWNNITRRHPTFFRHTKWYNDSKFILAHTENIIIKDFNCKIYSNNGLNENDGETEFCYMSNENTDFTNNRKEEFKLVTQLSSEEAVNKGASTAVAINAVLDSSTNVPILGFRYNDEYAKAEEHYINYYYNEYSTPKILFEACLKSFNGFNSLYSHNLLDKTFMIMGKDVDLKMNNAKIKLKEI